jgi:hypothetical protein
MAGFLGTWRGDGTGDVRERACGSASLPGGATPVLRTKAIAPAR